MDGQIYRFTVGAFQCAVIRDGGHMGSAEFLFTNAPPMELSAVLKDYGLESDQIPSSWVCFLVDTGDKTLLLDTGVGSGFGPGGGHLQEALHRAGMPANEIDLVVLTHGHPDHIGGCTDSNGLLLFPKARFVVNRLEWDFWTSEDNLATLGEPFAGFARRNLPPINGRVELTNGNVEILPGVSIVGAPGHTPGHVGLVLESKGEKLFCLADTVLHPIHIEYPEWLARVDMDPRRVVETRNRLLRQAADEGALVQCFHFDFPALGHVVQQEDRLRWRPLE